MRALKLVCSAVALVAFLAPGAHADDWNKRTYLTFSGPVQVPGATLPAGTYTFEIANPDTTRHVIRVSNKDTGQHIGLFMTIPNTRLDAPNDNLIMFAERPAGAAEAVKVWFYPGDKVGEEFVYPKTQAVAIAKANHAPVLATEDTNNAKSSEADRMSAMKSARVGHVDESGRMTNDDNAKVGTTAAPANTVDGGRTARAQAPATTAPRTNTADRSVGTSGSRNSNSSAARTGRRELPRTASNLTAFELLSIVLIGGGLATRRLRIAAESGR